MPTTTIALTLAALLLAPAPRQEPPSPSPKPASRDVALPADAERATQALLDSPRHGEWVVVPLAEGADAKPVKLRTWVSYPERSDKAPVVIVIHEIMGMTDWVRAVADQLAAEGFIAVAPDLLSGRGPDGGGTESFEGDKVRAAIRELSREEVARRLDAVREYATALPAATPRSACIGFCWGGSTSFAYATAQPALRSAVVWYGTAPREREALARIACPVLGLYGGDDARVTSTVESTRAAMVELGKTYTARMYEGAGHGFLRAQQGRDGKNLAASRRAWAEAVAFLERTLE
ncbi:MAG: dienelactone hydrolase family protein [Planctomycetota bacterium]|jgi:carboxymethylenebutenolidase